ncbi:beta family protein [Phycicoccus jejuensis]|uniref:beta family protein n=1 Tax=Phycicoccus jejuensis TaxID=367299 RepID=UPI0004C41A76|nr:hypothetical protein [Phycicoccus jejuensis]
MPLDQLDYVPCLKAREAEIKALMRAPQALRLTPLFELQRASAGSVDPATGQPRRAKATTTDISYFLDDIARLWSDPAYVDICRVIDGQVGSGTRWWRLLAALNDLAATPARLIPVLLISADQQEVTAAADVARTSGRLAVRVPMHETDPSPRLPDRLDEVATESGIGAADIDVLLDFADHTEDLALDELVERTIRTVDALGSKHGHIVTLGTPNSEAFLQVGDWDVARREWWLWLRVREAGRTVVFGDYALYPPANPVPASPQYGHLRYSSQDRLHVHRRAKPSSGGGLAAAFAVCCAHLVGQPHWLGASFSRADGRLADIAGNADKESSAGKWRQIAAEHHFALVADQLTSPPSSPAAGTA